MIYFDGPPTGFYARRIGTPLMIIVFIFSLIKIEK
jgi:hypothetical protein